MSRKRFSINVKPQNTIILLFNQLKITIMKKETTDNQVVNNEMVNNQMANNEMTNNEVVKTPQMLLAAALTAKAQESGYNHGIILLRQTEKRNYIRFISGRIKTPTPQKLLTAIVRARLNVSIVDEKFNNLPAIQLAGIKLDGAKNILNYSVVAYVNGDGKVNENSIFTLGSDYRSLRQATSMTIQQKKSFAAMLNDTACMTDGKLNFNAPKVKALVNNIVEVYYTKVAHSAEAISAVCDAIDLDKVINAETEKELSSKGAA